VSLRNRLITGIAIALALAGALTALVGGLGMRREVHQLLDQELGQIARISAQIVGPASPEVVPAREWKRGDRDSVVIVQRWYGTKLVELVPSRVRLPYPQEAGFRDVTIRGRSWRSYALKTQDGWVMAAQPNEARHELMGGAYWMAVLPVLVGLPLAIVLVMLVIRQALAPLHRIAGELQRRPALKAAPLDTTGVPAEVGPLVAAFNELLARVSTGIERERSFVTDAAHALRTPVTALLLQAESLREARSRTDAKERLDELVSGITRARRTVEQLLDLARSEASAQGQAAVCEALRTLSSEYEAILKEKDVTLNLILADTDDSIVQIERTRLLLAIHCLLENAVRYSPRGSTITIRAFTQDDTCQVWISDQGPGLPDDELERVFDRFYRPVNDGTAGTGLGLSIVRAIADGVGGRVWLARRSDGSGIKATLVLPTAGASARSGAQVFG
jgi:two-component system, OmpR family, sensor kinase